MIQHWLDESKQNPDDQDNFNEPDNRIRQCLILEDNEWPVNIGLLLKEWESTN